MPATTKTRASRKQAIQVSGGSGRSLIGRIWRAGPKPRAPTNIGLPLSRRVLTIRPSRAASAFRVFRRIKGDVAEFTVISYQSRWRRCGRCTPTEAITRVAHLKKIRISARTTSSWNSPTCVNDWNVQSLADDVRPSSPIRSRDLVRRRLVEVCTREGMRAYQAPSLRSLFFSS